MTAATRPKLTRADLTPDQLRHLQVCVHEAGHGVAQALVGGRVRSSVVFAHPSTGGILGRTMPDEIPHGRLAETVYAGPYCEARWTAQRRPTQRDMYDAFARHGCHDERSLIASGGVHLGHDITPLMERCLPAVLTVARKLHRDNEVSHADVLAALGITDGGGRGSVELANLRAGMRRVPPTSAPA